MDLVSLCENFNIPVVKRYQVAGDHHGKDIAYGPSDVIDSVGEI